jgi:ribosomal protein S18 acetylase RimI-like enzyme
MVAFVRYRLAMDTPLRLRQMRPDELAGWRERFVADWSADLARVEGLTPSEARREAARRTDADLPDGLATAGHHLRMIEEGDAVVGSAWFSIGTGAAFLDDLTVLAEHRGRGLGAAALRLIEAELVALGERRLDLHVYADNARAIALYAASGYRTTGLKMRKTLG